MTESRAETRVQRAESALRFARAVAAQDCPCGRPRWRVIHTSNRTRYVACQTCGRKQKIVAD
jgi:hypothetical protein